MRRIGGLPVDEAKKQYEEVHAAGYLRKSHYRVRLAPAVPGNDAMAGIPLVMDLSDHNPLWIRCVQAPLPILNNETETVKVGNMTYNRITGQAMEDMTFVLLETQKAEVFRSLIGLAALTHNGDGTSNPPARYALVLETGMFNDDAASLVMGKRFLVACQRAEPIDFDSATGDPLTISATFTPIDNYLTGQFTG